MVPRDRVQNQPSQGASTVVHPQKQSNKTSYASSLLQWRSHRTHGQSQIPRDPLRKNADVQVADRINKTQVQERTVRVDSHDFKGIEQRHLFLLYQNVKVSVIDYGLGLTILSQSNLLKLDRVQNEAMRVILGTPKDPPIETMRYLLDLPSMGARLKVGQVKAYINTESQESTPRCCQRRKGV